MILSFLKKIYDLLNKITTIQTQEIILTNANTAYALPTSPQSGRRILIAYNNSGTTIYWGGSDVMVANGIPLLDGKHIVIAASTGMYAVCGSAGKTLRIAEVK